MLFIRSKRRRRAIVMMASGSGIAIALISMLSIGGCGSGGIGVPTTGSGPSGTTAVTVLASSTANDQLYYYGLAVDSLTLTSSTGKKVSLISKPLQLEFIHLNGAAEPVTTVNIPEGTYTSASASFATGSVYCATTNSSDVAEARGFANKSISSPGATIHLATPIVVQGSSMALSWNLLVSQSVNVTNCNIPNLTVHSITPTFSLSQISSTQEPVTTRGLRGVITSVNEGGSTFAAASADNTSDGQPSPLGPSPNPDGPYWKVEWNSKTVFQGVSGAGGLSAYMPVDMDAVLQPDGTLLATRIAVYDTNASNLSVWYGPVIHIDDSTKAAVLAFQQELGVIIGGEAAPTLLTNSKFEISSEFSNLASLPFQASFNGQNMVDGQLLQETFHYANVSTSPYGTNATTVALMPQTIDGTVTSVGSNGGFTVYTVSLAPYDPLAKLAVEAGQTTRLSAPGTIFVYADSTTRDTNTNPVVDGSIVRFHGLVFNDQGTLRMDCDQIENGAPE